MLPSLPNATVVVVDRFRRRAKGFGCARRMPGVTRIIGLFAAVVGLVCLGPPTALAGNGAVQTFPMRGTPIRNGLRLEVDDRWVDANGYRPVRIRVSTVPTAPAVADRTLRIELQPQTWRWRGNQRTTAAYVELPQGSRAVETSISVPQYCGWENLQVACYEDGRLLTDLSGNLNVNPLNLYEWTEVIPAVLVIDRDVPQWAKRTMLGGLIIRGNASQGPRKLPDVRPLARRLPINTGNAISFPSGAIDDRTTLQVVDSMPRLEMLAPADLPLTWIDLTCFDLIYISEPDLRFTAQQFPDRCKALADWIRTGNALIVFDCDVSEDNLSAVAATLGPERDAPRPEDPGDWRSVTRHRASDEITGLSHLRNSVPYQEYPGTDDGDGTQVSESLDDEGDPLSGDSQLMRCQLGMGHLFAMNGAEPFGNNSRWLTWTLNSLHADNWMWCQRHGLSLHRWNQNFADWSIPGVGQAPVKSYLVLITLFVIAIGPVNYYLLRKKKRLYLLLVTVPAGAGLVSLALMAYALISDGLGVRTRVRSFTYLDQRTDHAVSWSRQTYYAGLAPSRGLQFPRDTVFFPIEYRPQQRRSGRQPTRLVWDENQWLADGYVQSRDTVQYLVIRSNASQRGLMVMTGDDGQSSPEVVNGLGTDIEMLLLRDRKKGFFWASGVKPKEQFRPRPISLAQAQERFRGIFDETYPRFPDGFETNQYYSMGTYRYYGGNVSDWDQQQGDVQMFSGLLERWLRDKLRGGLKQLPPQSYVAIVSKSPEVPLGTPGTREEASFHVIYGQW